MIFDHTQNFAETETDADIGTGDTSISVVDASVFDDPASVGGYDIVIGDSEVVTLTAIDTTNNALTVTRGQQNTSAQSFTAPVTVEQNDTAGLFDGIRSALSELADFSASPTEIDAPVNNTKTTTDALNIGDTQSLAQMQVSGKAVPVSASFGVADATTSVQSAIDAIANAGETGAVLLPPDYMSESTTITIPNGVGLFCPSGGWTVAGSSGGVLQVNDSPGILFDEPYRGGVSGGFTLRGPGMGSPNGPAIQFDPGAGNNLRNTFWHPMEIESWGGAAMEQTSGLLYQNTYTNILANKIDAGNAQAVFDFQSGAISEVLGYMGANVFNSHSGSNSRILNTDQKGWSINYLFGNQAVGMLFRQSDTGNAGSVTINQGWYEAYNQASRAPAVIQTSYLDNFKIHNLRLATGQTNEVYRIINNPANKWLAAPMKRSIDIAGDIVDVFDDTTPLSNSEADFPVTYTGVSADVVNNSGGTLSQPIACLGDLTTVS